MVVEAHGRTPGDRPTIDFAGTDRPLMILRTGGKFIRWFALKTTAARQLMIGSGDMRGRAAIARRGRRRGITSGMLGQIAGGAERKEPSMETTGTGRQYSGQDGRDSGPTRRGVLAGA